jgi:hypothetical protein
MLWENKVDCRSPMVTEAIRRDEVDAVLANLHFRDNKDITGDDRYYKVKKKFTKIVNKISYFEGYKKLNYRIVDKCRHVLV